MSKQRKADYEITFGSEEGKRVLRDMMDSCNFLKPSYQSISPEDTAFNDGKKAMVLHILGILAYKPDDIISTTKEIVKEWQRNK
jgi:hypothetical protein